MHKPVRNAWLCEHTDKKHKARGLCNACYLRQNGGSRRWYQNNKQLAKDRTKKWCHENPHKRRQNASRWARKNYLKDPEKGKQKTIQQYKTKLNYRLSWNLRTRLRILLKQGEHVGKMRLLIGCSINQLRQHLEKQFKDGMSWANYGKFGWHVDHVKPCAWFDLSDPAQRSICFHYTNLQPLSARENWSKGARAAATCMWITKLGLNST